MKNKLFIKGTLLKANLEIEMKKALAEAEYFLKINTNNKIIENNEFEELYEYNCNDLETKDIEYE